MAREQSPKGHQHLLVGEVGVASKVLDCEIGAKLGEFPGVSRFWQRLIFWRRQIKHWP